MIENTFLIFVFWYEKYNIIFRSFKLNFEATGGETVHVPVTFGIRTIKESSRYFTWS